jgi:hypothetical protein
MKDYKFYYKAGGKDLTEAVSGVNPISAINAFHKAIQTTQKAAADRKTVLRPKIRHDAYVVTRMTHVYLINGANSDFAESDMDYPRSANPDLSKKPAPEPIPQEGFGFVNSLSPGKLSSWEAAT